MSVSPAVSNLDPGALEITEADRLPAIRSPAAARGESFSELFRSALEFVRSARANGREVEMKETEAPEAAGKICPGYKDPCGAVLRPGNRTGLCVNCKARKRYAQAHKKQVLGPRKKVARPRPGRKVAAPAPASPRVSLEVTSEQLDRFLTQLPLEEKLQLANHYLKVEAEQ